MNQLKKVVDLTNSSQEFNDDATGTEASDISDDYLYDLNGNMTRDENKDITLIKYNHLNLPTEIQFTNSRTINYTYDATGIKLKKEVNDGTYITITDYLDGYQYEEKHTNLGGRGYSHLLFFPHAEGYVKPVFSQDKDNVLPKYQYIYNHTDHLGNIRVLYSKVNGQIEVLEENNYYSFGLRHQNYNSPVKKLTRKISDDAKSAIPAVENPYNYKYNGKELQDEFDLNWYDYGARNYQPDSGRWMSIDPLSEEYDSWSPYNYTLNNPVRFIDPDGRGVDDVIISGSKSQEYFDELQASVKGVFNLSMDNSGKVSYTRAEGSIGPLSKGDFDLAAAIDDSSIEVNVVTTGGYISSDGVEFIGDMFSGNVELNGVIVTTQDVSPGVLKKLDDNNDKPGASSKHAVVESYLGGLEAQNCGYSCVAPKIGNESNDVYDVAHVNAPPQGGMVRPIFYNKSGKEVGSPSKGGKSVYYNVNLKKNAGKPKIILEIKD